MERTICCASGGVEGVAAEGDGRSRLEDELLADDVLDGEVVLSVGDTVVAEELECAFIIIGGADDSRSVQAYVVVRRLVEQHAEGEVGVRVQDEVHVQVARDVVIAGDDDGLSCCGPGRVSGGIGSVGSLQAGAVLGQADPPDEVARSGVAC